MPRIITVSTLPDLYSALASATGGETILLAGGDYGKLSLIHGRQGVDATFPSNVTLASANPSDPAVFSGLDLRGAQNLSFDGIRFNYTFAAGDPTFASPFNISGSSDITIRNSTFDGDVARGISAVDDGFGYGRGLNVQSSSGITLENNDISNFHRGVVFLDVEGLSVLRNNVHDIRSDGMNFIQVRDVLIEGNHLHDFRASASSADHRDMIQFWTNGTNSPSENVTIRGNHLDIGTGDYTHSIFMRNEEVDQGRAGTAMFYRNITIEDNVIVNGHLHGISVGETAGLTIRNNSVLHADGGRPDGLDSGVEIPRISVSSSSTGVSITGNATAGINGWAGQAGWTVSNNAIVQDQNPQAPGHYSDVFVSSSLQPVNGVHDFRALADGLLGQTNAGASATRESPEGHLVAQFQVTSDETNAALRVFDATVTSSDLGTLPAGTTFTWTFGDGTSAQGAVVEHSYTKGGAFNVRLSATLPDGTTSAVTLPVKVEGPDVLALRPGLGFVAYETGAEILLAAPAALSATGLKLGAPGTSASVAREHIADLLVTDDFNIGLTLKASQTTSVGELFRIHGSLIVSVDAKGELSLQAFDDASQLIRLTTSGAKLNNAAPHSVNVLLDDGKLQVMIDGRLAGSTALQGTLSDAGGNLVFGNPWGRTNFAGDLQAFTITRDSTDFPAVAETVIIQGSDDLMARTAEVIDNDILTLDLMRGFIADVNGVDTVLGAPAKLSLEGLQLGAPGVTASVARAHVADILGADDFSIDLTLKADQPTSAGELFRLHMSFVATIDAKGDLNLRVWDTTGAETKLNTLGARLNDMASHDISIQYQDDVLQIMVDGDIAARADMPNGLQSSGGHDLVFGNPWNRTNFNGDLTAFEISTDDNDDAGSGFLSTATQTPTTDPVTSPVIDHFEIDASPTLVFSHMV